MALPIQLFGKAYLASLPTLADFSNFRDHLVKQHRTAQYDALPPNLDDKQLKQWMKIIDEQCQEIDPFEQFDQLANTSKGAALLFYSLLRRENKDVTLAWVEDIIARGQDEDQEALVSLHELRKALAELIRAKKNLREPQSIPESPLPIQTPLPEPLNSEPILSSST